MEMCQSASRPQNTTTTRAATTTTPMNTYSPTSTESKQQPRPTPATHVKQAVLARQHSGTIPMRHHTESSTTRRPKRMLNPKRATKTTFCQDSKAMVEGKESIEQHTEMSRSAPQHRAHDIRPNAKHVNPSSTQRLNGKNHDTVMFTMVQKKKTCSFDFLWLTHLRIKSEQHSMPRDSNLHPAEKDRTHQGTPALWTKKNGSHHREKEVQTASHLSSHGIRRRACSASVLGQAHSHRLELHSVNCGYEESRREQARLHEELAHCEKALRDTRIRNIHEVEELKRAQEMRIDEFSRCELRESHAIMTKLTLQIQELQERMNS